MENLNVDETSVSRFIYLLTKRSSQSITGVQTYDCYECAFDAGLLSEGEFACFVLDKNTEENQNNEQFKKLKAKILQIKGTDIDKISTTKEDRDSLYKKAILISHLLGQITFRVPVSEPESYRQLIKPDYILSVVDIDEFRFARKQALDAQESAKKATKLATQSLNWTVAGFIASVVFSLSSIVITLTSQNTISIDKKQANELIEKLTKKLDSLQQKK